VNTSSGRQQSFIDDFTLHRKDHRADARATTCAAFEPGFKPFPLLVPIHPGQAIQPSRSAVPGSSSSGLKVTRFSWQQFCASLTAADRKSAPSAETRSSALASARAAWRSSSSNFRHCGLRPGCCRGHFSGIVSEEVLERGIPDYPVTALSYILERRPKAGALLHCYKKAFYKLRGRHGSTSQVGVCGYSCRDACSDSAFSGPWDVRHATERAMRPGLAHWH